MGKIRSPLEFSVVLGKELSCADNHVTSMPKGQISNLFAFGSFHVYPAFANR